MPNCFPEYTVQFEPGRYVRDHQWMKGIMTVELDEVSKEPGRSSNSGDSTDFDYKFDPDKQTPNRFKAPVSKSKGQSMETVRELDTVKVVVSSLDYGGKAQLKAKVVVKFDGPGGLEETINAEIDGAKKADATFASIPVDENDNGIADSWEQSFGGTGRLRRNEDDEPGAGGAASPKGDGFPAFDEYRGFHHLTKVGTAVVERWTRTDPKTKQDVFFLDPSGQFRDAVAPILGAQGGSNPIHVYRQVRSDQVDSNRAVNFKGLGIRDGFAVTYQDSSLPGGILGDAGGSRNDGSTPIMIDVAKVRAFSARVQFDPALMLAQVVAHETGHKFGRRHPLRTPCCTEVALPSVPNTLDAVSLSQFGVRGSQRRQIYIRLSEYQDPVSSVRLMADSYVIEPPKDHRNTIQVRDSVAGVHLYRIAFESAIPASPNHWVQIQEARIMDWSPRVTLRSAPEWAFSAEDFSGLCVHPNCRK
ncbi:MAG: hypothetical protein U0Q16_27000 [Bryobacteraceae bacterium]